MLAGTSPGITGVSAGCDKGIRPAVSSSYPVGRADAVSPRKAARRASSVGSWLAFSTAYGIRHTALFKQLFLDITVTGLKPHAARDIHTAHNAAIGRANGEAAVHALEQFMRMLALGSTV